MTKKDSGAIDSLILVSRHTKQTRIDKKKTTHTKKTIYVHSTKLKIFIESKMTPFHDQMLMISMADKKSRIVAFYGQIFLSMHSKHVL